MHPMMPAVAISPQGAVGALAAAGTTLCRVSAAASRRKASSHRVLASLAPRPVLPHAHAALLRRGWSAASSPLGSPSSRSNTLNTYVDAIQGHHEGTRLQNGGLEELRIGTVSGVLGPARRIHRVPLWLLKAPGQARARSSSLCCVKGHASPSLASWI